MCVRSCAHATFRRRSLQRCPKKRDVGLSLQEWGAMRCMALRSSHMHRCLSGTHECNQTHSRARGGGIYELGGVIPETEVAHSVCEIGSSAGRKKMIAKKKKRVEGFGLVCARTVTVFGALASKSELIAAGGSASLAANAWGSGLTHACTVKHLLAHIYECKIYSHHQCVRCFTNSQQLKLGVGNCLGCTRTSAHLNQSHAATRVLVCIFFLVQPCTRTRFSRCDRTDRRPRHSMPQS